MMKGTKIACFTFTKNGEMLAHKLKDISDYEIDIFDRDKFGERLKKICKETFEKYKALIFFSSTGIAVRLIAPYVKDKTRDPAVVVIDDLGRYAISLLSGHIGGANELTKYIARKMNVLPIITTASDGRNFEAVDVFACRHGFVIENIEDAKKITAMMVENKDIELMSEVPAFIKYDNIVEQNGEGHILVTSRDRIECNKPRVVLRPKILHVGIGCRKGAHGKTIIALIEKICKENNLSTLSIKSLGTIEMKREEAGILEVCEHFGCPLEVFAAKEIKKVQNRFSGSDFVKAVVGVRSVAEPCAFLCGGEIIVPKVAEQGVTIAVSKEV